MGKNDYEIKLKNCRNIASLKKEPLLIRKNVLNVFYGKNGTGKTTLVRALHYIYAGTDEAKLAIASHRYQESGDPADEPVATCATRINRLLVFNDEWVSSHCFEKSSVQQNVFELYIRDGEMKKLGKRRDSALRHLRAALESDEVDELKRSLARLQKDLGKLKGNGDFVANAPIAKAFKAGVPIEEIPRCLSRVVSGMTAKEKAEWIDWHIKRPVIRHSEICPYCGTSNKNRLEKCNKYDDSRDSSAVKQWAAIAAAYDDLRERLSRSNAALLGRVLRSKKAPSVVDLDSLAVISAKAAEAIEAVNGLSGALKDENCSDAAVLTATLMKHAKTLSGCEVFRKTSVGQMTSEAKALSSLIRAVKSIEAIQADLTSLSKELTSKIADNVSGHESEINEFLAQCGYPYEISIVSNPQTSEARMLLKPSRPASASWHVENPGDSLSYGERNALALVLFMFEAIREPGALIVLDDPISSFDYDKRYGILYALFASEGIFSKNLRGKSVLVMTHDFLVVVDLIRIPGQDVSATKVKGQFLRCDSSGVLHVAPLGKDAIAPYAQILRRKIREACSSPEIVRLVYIRSLCEMLRRSNDDRRTRYGWTFKLLSDIVHGRNAEAILAEHKLKGRDCREVRMCERCVKELGGVSFDFWKAVDDYSDCTEPFIRAYGFEGLSSVEKLGIVRLLIMRDPELAASSKIMKRFADESCHIGGDYLFQMDDRVYDQVPFYVVNWCDDVVAQAKRKLASTQGA